MPKTHLVLNIFLNESLNEFFTYKGNIVKDLRLCSRLGFLMYMRTAQEKPDTWVIAEACKLPSANRKAV